MLLDTFPEAHPDRMFDNFPGSGFMCVFARGEVLPAVGINFRQFWHGNAASYLNVYRRPALLAIAFALLIAMALPRWQKTASILLTIAVIGAFAGLDRISVQHAIGYLKSPDATVQQKAVAAAKLSKTFFWKGTARKALMTVQPDAPEGLARFYEAMMPTMSFR